MTHAAGRPRWWVAGLVAFVCLAVGAVVWQGTRPDTYVAHPPRATPTATARPDLAGTTLAALVRAVRSRDGAAAAALGSGDEATALLRAVATNAAALGVTGFSARYVGESDAVAADGSWGAAVDLSWRFAGYDAAPVREEVRIGFAPVGDAVAITGLGGGDLRSPLWLTGPVQVRRTGDALVLAPDSATATRFAGLAGRAVAVVRRVVTGWDGPLVLEVPRSAAALDGALGAAPGTYAGVAAVTASVDGSSASDAPVHVFANPEVMGGLDRRGAQIVVSHEATHLATHAATNTHRPIWLTEGFADYVALRDVRLPLSTTAGQVLASVREDGPPDHLPDSSDFDSRSASFGAEYEAAWLVCRVVAERAGERGLVAVYDRVGAGQDLDRVLRDELGTGTRGLTRLWRQRLSHWAA